MIPAELPRLHEMISLLLEQQLTSDEQQELVHALESDAQARATYRELLRLHVLLAAQHAPSPAYAPPMPGRLARGWDMFYDVIKQPMALGAIISGLFLTTILLSLALIVPERELATPAERVPSTEFVARITAISEATFDQASHGNLRNRDLFDDDTIVLNSGLVVITYDTGARVVLEGPATYHIDGANGGDLRLGKLVARVDTPESHGFAVAIPGARIVDLGTEFGAEVSADGGSQVAVLSGEVELVGEGQPPLRIVAGEAASAEAGSGNIARQDVANSEFASALASRLRRLEYPPIAVRATAERFEGRDQATNMISGFQVAGGNNRKLVLAASWESADSNISAVWKGQEPFRTAIISGTGRNCAILYLDDPTPGRGDIVVTFGSATHSRIGVVSLINAAAGVGPTSSNDGVAGSLATTEPDSLVVGVYTTNSPVGKVSGPFSQTIYNGDAGSCWGNAGCQSEPIAGLKSYSWKAAGAKEDAHVLAAFVGTAVSTEQKAGR